MWYFDSWYLSSSVLIKERFPVLINTCTFYSLLRWPCFVFRTSCLKLPLEVLLISNWTQPNYVSFIFFYLFSKETIIGEFNQFSSSEITRHSDQMNKFLYSQKAKCFTVSKTILRLRKCNCLLDNCNTLRDKKGENKK